MAFFSKFFNPEYYCLVLGGGGAKGAYQIGAWRALVEDNIKFNCVIGSSVGALNGAFIVQNDYEKALKIWENISTDMIVDIPKEFIKDGLFHISKNSLAYLTDLQKKIFSNKGLDTSPLQKMIKEFLIEEKIRKSGADFGIVTFELERFKPIEVFLEDVELGKLSAYLMASSTLPGFKKTKIEGKSYVDGGFNDLVPFNIARNRGYNKIIAIDISGVGIKRKAEIYGTNIIYIRNSMDMGSILDFSPDISKRNIKMGYLDTLKALQKCEGIDYFYREDRRLADNIEMAFFNEEVFKNYKKYLLEDIKFNFEDIRASLKNCLPREERYHKNFFVPFMERTATALKVEKLELYELKDFLKKIMEKYRLLYEIKFKEQNKFDAFLNNIKITQTIINKSFIKDNDILPYLLSLDIDDKLYLSALGNLFPDYIPSKIFIEVLKKIKF
ncbi:MAG TPA: patatin-like phospholipase family protein [Spirochaetota bacterium]|jgi:NTE family protein|nr:MAG: hypothetical protein BWX91_00153 [Spirochaetes bacterium ADurb.Bin133]HNZ26336.1 patatin-like phospholipase family protein [Spirochaetota bacterium]HPY86785.1 patatin-like phospholipase family protein [Spirochaetota bacterium]HQB61021.1 patatin-like phospholipase family protein [Spirochaetota bacterium]